MSARRILLNGAVARSVYGLLSLFVPRAIFSAAGQRKPPPDTRYFNALFGGRDLTVAGLTVAAVRAGREREALLANVSCELTDLLALVQEVRAGRRLDSVLVVGALFNAGGWLSWTMAARALRAEASPAPEDGRGPADPSDTAVAVAAAVPA
jgi:hypothetical protein